MSDGCTQNRLHDVYDDRYLGIRPESASGGLEVIPLSFTLRFKLLSDFNFWSYICVGSHVDGAFV